MCELYKIKRNIISMTATATLYRFSMFQSRTYSCSLTAAHVNLNE